MAVGNEWINGYLEAILDAGVKLREQRGAAAGAAAAAAAGAGGRRVGGGDGGDVQPDEVLRGGGRQPLRRPRPPQDVDQGM